jgi:hypothetical protein
MSAVVDMMVKPILMIPPFFVIPPVTTVICGAVELIKGGQIEEIPGIGQIIKYGRESILILVLLLVLFIKAFQYISPNIWHFVENHLKDQTPRPQPPRTPDVKKDEGIGYKALNVVTFGISDTARQGAENISSIVPLVKYYFELALWYIYHSCWNAFLTGFIQIPFDILAWDLESLSVDFGNLWGSESNIFREDCRRFINGSYAGDFTLYEGENIDEYLRNSLNGSHTDQYLNSKSEPKHYYLCTHGNWCKDIADVFGKTMMGKNGSLSEDNSPTDGYVNGINISSAPRKYSVCCSGIPISDCDEQCKENSPIDIDNIQNPASLITDLGGFIQNPKNTMEELIDIFLPPALNLKDYEAIKCNFQNSIHDFWKKQCTYQGGHTKGKSGILDKGLGYLEDAADAVESAALPCPDTLGFHKNTCTETMDDIRKHIKEAYDKRVKQCHDDCKTTNNQQLNYRGCNYDYMEKAKRSALRNENDTVNAQLPRYYDSNNIRDRAIKRTPWKSGERPPEFNPDAAYYTGQERSRRNQLITNGIDCSRHDLSDYELEDCFGPFRPMTPLQYPVLFYKITKDFMGSILWSLLAIFVLFIILYILCLFNPIGRAAYELNKNAGMVEGGMESMGMDMKDLNIDKISNMIK